MTPHGPAPEDYARRRRELLATLDGAVLCIPPVPESIYSNDVGYRYRPDSNTRYLSGFEDPAALVLAGHAGDERGFTLCVEERDERSETWTGRREGLEGARDRYGADHAHPLDRWVDVLTGHLREADRFYYAPGRDDEANRRVFDAVAAVNRERPRSGRPSLAIDDAAALVAERRWRKDDVELQLMRRAATITADAHCRLMETLRPGQFEYQAEALLEHGFRHGGCAGPAYGSIVAAGANATVLHYTRNDCPVESGQVLLVDAGGEFGGYCADLTRTIPADATFESGAAAVYDVVLDAQAAALAKVAPGGTLDAVHDAAVDVLCDGLVRLGIAGGSAAECKESGAYRTFYMHNTSHWLGMDVHDVGDYRRDGVARPLEPGAVLTVEPGLYIRTDAEVPERYRGVGVRIEDDVVVTADAGEVLTDAAPKTRPDIEKLRAAAFA